MKIPRHFVVRFQRQEQAGNDLFLGNAVESIVVEAENVPMALKEFYRELSDNRKQVTLLEVFEKRSMNGLSRLLKKKY